MPEEQKTVFISYRWTPAWALARLVHDDLVNHGYDVFLDVTNTSSGKLEDLFLRQIEARAHFLVVLTLGTVEGCSNQNDWMRREIEHAMDTQRNIVPLLGYGFSFTRTEKYLTGKLDQLHLFSGWPLDPYSFDAEMETVRDRFLRQSFNGKIRVPSVSDQLVVQQYKAKAAAQPPPTKAELQVEDYDSYILQEQNLGDADSTIIDYSEVGNFNPEPDTAKNVMDYSKEAETALYEIMHSAIRQASLARALSSNFESYTELVKYAGSTKSQTIFQQSVSGLDRELEKYGDEIAKELPNFRNNWEIVKNGLVTILLISPIVNEQDVETLKFGKSQFENVIAELDRLLPSIKENTSILGKFNDTQKNLHPAVSKVQTIQDEQYEIYYIGKAYLARIINLIDRKLSEFE